MNNKYERSSQEYEDTLVNWDGMVSFSNVFVTKFPEPSNAHKLSAGLWNNNGIYLAQAQYGGNMLISISCSTLPDNRTPNEDMNILHSHLSSVAKEHGTASNGYELMRVYNANSLFGDTLIYEITNAARSGNNIPFPLNIGATYPIENGLQSMAMNLIFQRPEANSRVELSILYELPKDYNARPDQDVAGDLHNMLVNMHNEFLSNTYHLTKEYLN